ncbi:MAG TPA: hypothetical protein VFZ21_03800 [Gemmatimonadaceae bacterium]|nr:hypothetical protein [Gemmatimonadaceae bacterium]
MPKIDLRLAGDDYVPVADRIRQFYERFATGRIVTHLVRRTDDEVIVRAEVFRTVAEREPAATGWAAEREGDGDINTVACLENTETSAIGRALANLGFAASKLSETRAPRTSHDSQACLGRSATPTASDRAAHWPIAREHQARRLDPALQRRADRATEILSLLVRAERLGLSSEKLRVPRTHATRADADLAMLARLDRRLRDWLERQLDRVDGW